MNKIQNLEQIKERVKEYLPEYLESHGRRIGGGRNFNCINPSHPDHDPSCGVVPDNKKLFHCFGCGVKGDIFLAAHFLEGKPLTGKPFIVDTLRYLAQRFGMEMPEINITPEEVHEMEMYRAYQDAASILLNSRLGDLVVARIEKLGWTPGVREQFGVGGVTSYDDYIDRMTKHYGHKFDFLEEIDLARKELFNEDNLFHTVCDELGRPVGFACRNLRFAEQKEAYDKKVADLLAQHGGDKDSKEFKEAKRELGRPPVKYNNSSAGTPEKPKNTIYQKGKRLYGFHVAKKFTPPLYVFEGYGDCVTGQNHGLKNCCAIGATAFTKDHLEMLMHLGVKHMVFTLDGDDGGYKGTDSFVALIEEVFGGRPGIRVEIVSQPEGTDDPDAYIRKYGLKDFLALPKLDIFQWRLKRAIDKGEDPLDVCARVTPLIVNQDNSYSRIRMAQQLSQVTGVAVQDIKREVDRLVDAELGKVEEEKVAITNRLISSLKKNPENPELVLRTAMDEIEVVTKKKTGYDVQIVMGAVDYVFNKAEQEESDIQLATGWPLFDQNIGGIPKSDCFISMPGKPNEGKSTWMANLLWRLLKYNKDVCVVLHTIDDSLPLFLPRVFGSMTKIPSDVFKKAGYFLKHPEDPRCPKDFYAIWQKVQAWMRKEIENERLIVADLNVLAGTLQSWETWVRALRQKKGDTPIVCLNDNFHLYQFPGGPTDPAHKYREMSMFIKRVVNEQRCTSIFTCELPKESLKPGVRPRMGNIRGTSGVAYDANLNWGVYNDLKGMREEASLFWEDQNDMQRVTSPDNIVNHVPRKEAILEGVFDKSKISSFDGSLYYRLKGITGHVEECSEAEQTDFATKAIEGTKRAAAAAAATSRAPHKSAF